MSDEFVTLEQAKHLAAAGFPQGQWPQMAWADRLDGAGPGREYWLSERGAWFIRREDGRVDRQFSPWDAAPTYLQALDWLESEHGWRWERIAEGWWGEAGSGVFDEENTGRLESASALLDAILDRLEATPPSAAPKPPGR